ncbi:MAG: hypothetical protein AVO35_06705 [Candidatus Aegiribacteria sp. MLS_C]|nr:MAG: hypothetical protein AVO35_06705 [Candidatus Aegiribacteria sp. MLS_C]
MMLFLAALLAMTPAELEGFWNSEPDVSDGYGSCYFFWETGEYAFLRSINEGIVYTGEWYSTADELVLNRREAVRLDGSPVDMGMREISMVLTETGGKNGRIFLDGDAFYRLGDDPDLEILSLMPAWGMSPGERDAFSTYD